LIFFADELSDSRKECEMHDSFEATVSGRSAAVVRVISLLLLASLAANANAQTHQLKIKIINAKTNHPITDERLNVALRTDQIGSVPMATDKDGLILVDIGHATIIRILSNMYGDCRPRSELYTNYSIATIMQTGITTGNQCSSASPKPVPGELILFEVPRSFIPQFPAPPKIGLPHSDENPHAPQT
jgi:hypothetical protein